jgi:hypothetical protein
METIIKTNGYTLEFNGSATYMIVDECGTCLLCTNTLKKAKNFLNKTLKLSGLL